MVAPGKGALAIAESAGTGNKRFEQLGIAQTSEMRRTCRELVITAPGLSAGRPCVDIMTASGMLPGIKVDTGTVTLPGTDNEKIIEGLDGPRVPSAGPYGSRRWKIALKA